MTCVAPNADGGRPPIGGEVDGDDQLDAGERRGLDAVEAHAARADHGHAVARRHPAVLTTAP